MSYRKILAVINEHTGSTVSARYAMALAATGRAELVLYSCHNEGSNGAISRHTDHHLDHLFEDALAQDIAVTRISETGPVTRLLPHRIQAEGADLVFYPLTHGEQYGAPLRQYPAHQLLRMIKTDLAIMRIMHMGKPHPRHILVPVGAAISDREQRARFLAALAMSFHSLVTLFHRTEIGKQDLPEDLLTLRNELRHYQLPVLERCGSGQIARTIVLEAVSHHNDLIVLGASERGRLRSLLFGNPAGDVMSQPPCNAILFRPARSS